MDAKQISQIKNDLFVVLITCIVALPLALGAIYMLYEAINLFLLVGEFGDRTNTHVGGFTGPMMGVTTMVGAIFIHQIYPMHGCLSEKITIDVGINHKTALGSVNFSALDLGLLTIAISYLLLKVPPSNNVPTIGAIPEGLPHIKGCEDSEILVKILKRPEK